MSEIAFRSHVPSYYYVIIWIIVSGSIFGLQYKKFKVIFSLIRQRMKNSTTWPVSVKTINGICWAVPFVVIAFFPEFSQYLILLGIGLGNISTFIFMKKFSGINNKEQLLVGIASIALILPAYEIDSSYFLETQDIAVLLSRLFIAVSYAIGGIYAIYQKD
ncbi:MAG: hypothetical protein ACE5GR_02645 [Nitrosopumilus sp.]